MDACAESARDAIRLPQGRDRAGEMRTGIECALRRAGQLTETLAPFRERPPSNE
jgi:hypothetical protein